MPDLTEDITFRGFSFNSTTLTPGSGEGTGITGCTVDDIEIGPPEVVQFVEKRALHDGMDVGDIFHGGRTIIIHAGTLYAVTREAFFSAKADLDEALDAVQAFADGTFGYRPLVWIENRTGGPVTCTAYCRPNGLRWRVNRDRTGEGAANQLAGTWATSFYMRDPKIYET